MLVVVMISAMTVSSSQQHQQRPNILLLITDDQDLILGGIEHMPMLDQYMTQQGTTFRNYFVHTAICCPSRSAILTGRYFQNHGVVNNSYAGNCDGPSWQRDIEPNFTMGVYAKRAGYRTGYSGKYTNTYASQGAIRVPTGWDKWLAIVGNIAYYNYSVIQSDNAGANFTKRAHGNSYVDDYFSDVVANRTLDMIRDFTTTSTQQEKSSLEPFLIVNAWPAPHVPQTPAPWARGRFKNKKAPRTPNWNASEVYNQQKHWLVRKQSPIDKLQEQLIDSTYYHRLETLLSVDQHIEQFISLLKERGVLNNTIIIYTSDNGFNLGQHRLLTQKSHMYEQDVRVPFIVRGPNIPKNVSSFDLVASVDIVPTIYQLIHNTTSNNQSVPLPNTMDGISFLPILLHNSTQRRQDLLITYHGESESPCHLDTCPAPPPDDFHEIDSFNNTYHCIRSIAVGNHTDFTYCEFEDDQQFIEYFDNYEDPWQLHNQYYNLSDSVKATLKERLAALKVCRGDDCRKPWRPPTATVAASEFQPRISTSSGYHVGGTYWMLLFTLLVHCWAKT